MFRRKTRLDGQSADHNEADEEQSPQRECTHAEASNILFLAAKARLKLWLNSLYQDPLQYPTSKVFHEQEARILGYVSKLTEATVTDIFSQRRSVFDESVDWYDKSDVNSIADSCIGCFTDTAKTGRDVSTMLTLLDMFDKEIGSNDRLFTLKSFVYQLSQRPGLQEDLYRLVKIYPKLQGDLFSTVAVYGDSAPTIIAGLIHFDVVCNALEAAFPEGKEYSREAIYGYLVVEDVPKAEIIAAYARSPNQTVNIIDFSTELREMCHVHAELNKGRSLIRAMVLEKQADVKPVAPRIAAPEQTSVTGA